MIGRYRHTDDDLKSFGIMYDVENEENLFTLTNRSYFLNFETLKGYVSHPVSARVHQTM